MFAEKAAKLYQGTQSPDFSNSFTSIPNLISALGSFTKSPVSLAL